MSDTIETIVEAHHISEPDAGRDAGRELANVLSVILAALHKMRREPLDLKSKWHLKKAEQATHKAIHIVSKTERKAGTSEVVCHPLTDGGVGLDGCATENRHQPPI